MRSSNLIRGEMYEPSREAVEIRHDGWLERIYEEYEREKQCLNQTQTAVLPALPAQVEKEGNSAEVNFQGLVNLEEQLPAAPEKATFALEKTAEQEQRERKRRELEEELARMEEQCAQAKNRLQEIEAQAQEILNEAKTKAEKFLKDAQSEREKILEEAKRLGWEDGFDAGRAEAEKQARQALEAEQQKIRNWFEDLTRQKEKWFQDREPLVVDLVSAAFSKILEIEAEERKTLIEKTVQKVLKKAQDRVAFRLHVHPDDAAWLKEKKLTDLPIVANEKIAKGGCLLETEVGSVDARRKTLVEQLEETLRHPLSREGER